VATSARIARATSPSDISSSRPSRTADASVSREIPALTIGQRDQLDALVALVATDERAPTAIKSREEVERLHVADSLVALQLTPVGGAREVADLGSGAGFPGLALAVALPEARVTVLDSQRRKCAFLERAIAIVGIDNATAVCARAEEWSEGLRRHDLVVARALASQSVVLEYAAPLLALGGVLVDWRGRRDSEDEAPAERAAAELGLRRVEVREVTPFAASTDRHLHVFAKEAETPERFPRRAGIARKRPLGRRSPAESGNQRA
jgi:16S rRNA (guanine527-N7)-methyltransferase